MQSNGEQKSNQANRQKSYRIVESIEENRPASAYQDDMEPYGKIDDFIISEENNLMKGNKIVLNIGNGVNNNNSTLKFNNYSGIYNPTSRSRGEFE